MFVFPFEFGPNHLDWVLIINIVYDDKQRVVRDQIVNHVKAIVCNCKVK